jgi:hypothetical protein
MSSTDPSSAPLTLSGRALAAQRRAAMALRGKAAASRSAAAAAAPAARAPLAAALPAAVVPTPATSAARLRRQALSQTGKAALAAAGVVSPVRQAADKGRRDAAADAGGAPGCGCAGGCGGGGEPARRPAAAQFEADPAGGAEVLHGAPMIAAGRRAAMARRQALSRQGAGAAAPSSRRPSGRVRPAAATRAAPPKVGESHTLAGRTVTGTLLDATARITGIEAGQCRTITGTEYLGLEPFQSLCGTRPAPGPAKVGESRTLHEQRITGTELGRSPAVTGDEHGACRRVTGTEYLGLEQFVSVCGTEPPSPPPRKVSVMSTPRGQTVSGAPMERSVKVTGDEHGAAIRLTGTDYQGRTEPAAVPPKVGEAPTRAGTSVTGTEVAPSARVSGGERGLCRAVTGTDYLGPAQQQAVCATPSAVQPVAKVGEDRTLHGQPVTGTQVGRGQRVTGDEAGACAPVSGTPYVGRQQVEGFCSPTQRDRQQALLPERTVVSAAAVSGDRPGAGGRATTGDERGACAPVSGTPYVGADNAPAACPVASALSSRFLPRPASPAPQPSTPAPTDFSIVPPSRQVLERAQRRGVTGSAFDGQRITGPVNKAGGLITGTPEFRHVAPPVSAEPAATVPPAASRLTGAGQQIPRLSGDAWADRQRVTGTEGASAQVRNPSQRGQPRGMGASAMRFREQVERADVPPSPVTGSSGNTLRGATITVSGGARA